MLQEKHHTQEYVSDGVLNVTSNKWAGLPESLDSGLGSEEALPEPEEENDYISPKETTVLMAIENVVSRIEDTVPLTGIYSVEEELTGWHWDKNLVQSSNAHETLYRTYLGGHEVGLKEGTSCRLLAVWCNPRY